MKTKLLRQNAQYQKQVEQLLSALGKNDDAILNMSALDGGWSAIQVVHHLVLTEELSMKYVQKKLSFNPALKVAGWPERIRSVLIWFYLNLPFKFKAPEIVNENSMPGFTTFADARDRWLKIRQEWAAFLEAMPPELEDKAVYRHPIAGRMSWSGVFVFFQHHLTRHRKQIWRTLGK